MKRGELWTAAGGAYYAGKPRPVLVIQDDRFDATDSVTICPLTTDPTEIPLLRIPVASGPLSGLDRPSRIMVDKVTTMPRSRLGQQIGRVTDAELLTFARALVVFLGLV